MDAHISQLRNFVKENVFIRFLHGDQERSKEAFICNFSGYKIILEGLHDPSGRTYKIRIPQILEICSLEKQGKIWRQKENDRI